MKIQLPPHGSSVSTRALIAIAASAVLVSCGEDSSDTSADATYVGGARCQSCHVEESDAWRGSHHDLAMQETTPTTVLGDFGDTSFEGAGGTTRFRRDGDRFFIETAGPDGSPTDFEVAYVFGVEPLQQYLIELDGGRLQAFTVAWDSRSAEQGGQRWFDLYPAEAATWGGPLHWAGPGMNWNYMCAGCHSTDLQKNFDLATTTYATTWSDLDVSCEACHGPGSIHVERAGAQRVERAIARREAPEPGGVGSIGGLRGVPTDIDADWVLDSGATTARRSEPRSGEAEIGVCAQCHSRRATISETSPLTASIHDRASVRWLDAGLYHADGQMLDEVYVYGSFVQSRMYAEGVRCADCHDPHSLDLVRPGNALCSGCHLPAVYDASEHHGHPTQSSGAECVACHMPTRTYMGVDARRDHSIRVPRPGFSDRTGAPDACSTCHMAETTAWMIEALDRWYGPQRDSTPHFGEALHAGRVGAPGSAEGLRALAGAGQEPAIARATALGLLASHPDGATLETVVATLDDADPFVRLGALATLDGYPTEARSIGLGALSDTIRSVRIEAARVLAPVDTRALTARQVEALSEATTEYVAAQMVNADHPSAHVNVGNLRVRQGDPVGAEIAYRDAMRVDSLYAPAYLNLADVYRATGREEEGRALLEVGLRMAPEEANLHHAIGLSLIRAGEDALALASLRRAVALAPEQPRFSYVLAVAHNSGGDSGVAIEVLVEALTHRPYDRELLTLMAQIHRDRGDMDRGLEFARRLVEVVPDDPQAQQLLAELGGR